MTKHETSKKTLLEMVNDIEQIMINNKLSAQEILMVLRIIETNALMALFLAQMFKANETPTTNK